MMVRYRSRAQNDIERIYDAIARDGASSAQRIENTRATTLPYREWRLIGPAKGHASQDDVRRFQVHLALSLVVARINELNRSFDNFQHGYITRSADLERSELRNLVDDLGGIDCCHCDDLF